jgi:hypothetical protein
MVPNRKAVIEMTVGLMVIYGGIHSSGPELYQQVSNRHHFSGELPAFSGFDLRRRRWNHD